MRILLCTTVLHWVRLYACSELDLALCERSHQLLDSLVHLYRDEAPRCASWLVGRYESAFDGARYRFVGRGDRCVCVCMCARASRLMDGLWLVVCLRFAVAMRHCFFS